MNPSVLRILMALFLIAHGWIHYSLTYVPTPQPGGMHTPFWPSWKRADIDNTWLAARLGLPSSVVRGAGALLCVLALAGFALAGLGLLGIPGLSAIWSSAAIGASIASLLLLAFYWHTWLIMGVLIDLAVLAAVQFHQPVFLFASK